MAKSLITKAEEYCEQFPPELREYVQQAWLDGYESGRRSKTKKKELDLSFVPEDFSPIVQRWVQYKEERKQRYTQTGIESCYNKLYMMSNGNTRIAAAIVEQSIANNWAGLFELKENGTQQQQFGSATANQYAPGSRKQSVADLAALASGVLQKYGGSVD